MIMHTAFGDFECLGTSSLKYCVEHFQLNSSEWREASKKYPNLEICPIFMKNFSEDDEFSYIIRFGFKNENNIFNPIYEDKKSDFILNAISRKISDINFDVKTLYEKLM